MTPLLSHSRRFVFTAFYAAFVLTAQQSESWDAKVKDGVAALRAGRYAQAVQLLTAAREDALTFPPLDARRANTSHLLAMAHQFLGQFDRAESLYLEAKNTLEAQGEAGREVLGFTLDGLGQLRFEQERWQEAEKLLGEAIGVCTTAYGDASPCTLTAQRHLGEIYSMAGRITEAESIFQQVIDRTRQSARPLGQLLPTVLRDLAYLHVTGARYQKAEPLLKEALELSSETGMDSSEVADSLLPLGRLYRLQKDNARAEPLLNRAAAIYAKANDPCLAHALQELGLMAVFEGKYAVAKQKIEQSIAIYQKYLGADHINVAFARIGLAEAYLGEKNYTQAESLVKQAMAKENQLLIPTHYELARAHMVAANIDRAQKRDSQAEAHYRQALAIYRRTLSRNDPDLANAEQQYSRFVKALRK